jgi:hypothetical protein
MHSPPVMPLSSSLLTVCGFPLSYKNPPLVLTQCRATHPDTHFDIAKYAIERKIHVLVTKPAVQTLKHHNELIALAKANGVVCWVEHHKRYGYIPTLPMS